MGALPGPDSLSQVTPRWPGGLPDPLPSFEPCPPVTSQPAALNHLLPTSCSFIWSIFSQCSDCFRVSNSVPTIPRLRVPKPRTTDVPPTSTCQAHLGSPSSPWLSSSSSLPLYSYSVSSAGGRSLLFLHPVPQTPPWARETLDGDNR